MSFFGDSTKGSSWSGLLKQAINNVESKLDKVLDFPEEENKVDKVPNRSNVSPRVRTIPKSSDPLSGNLEIGVKKPESKPTTLKTFKDEIIREEQNFKSPIKPVSQESKPTPKNTIDTADKAQVSSVKPPPDKSNSDSDKDYKAIAEQREKQLINAIQSTSALNETIQNLQAELVALKAEKTEDEEKLTSRIKDLESKLDLRKSLDDGSNGSFDQKLLKQVEELQKQLDAKTEQVADLLVEGEILSKKEVKVSTILQKLRAKEADSEKALAECQKKLGQSVKEVSDLKIKLGTLSSTEKTQAGSVRTLNSRLDQLSKEKEKLEAQVLRLTESESGLKSALNKTQKELKTLENERKKTSQEALNATIKKEKQENQRLSDEVLAVRAQLEEVESEAQKTVLELRQELSRAQDEFSFREEELLKEIKDWQDKQMDSLHYSMSSINPEMDSIIEASTKPLLTELAALRDHVSQIQLKHNACERELNHCMESKHISDQAQKTLSQELLVKTELIESLENSQKSLNSKIQELQVALDKSNLELREASNQINELKVALKTTNTKHAQELDHLRKLYEFESPNPSCSASPRPLVAHPIGSPARISLDAASLFSSIRVATSDARSEKSVESQVSPSNSKSSHQEDSPQASFDAKLRSLQIQLLSSIEARDHLSSDLVRVTARLKLLEKNLARLEAIELEHKDLLLKHDTALILLGEKEEQVGELKADIQDMKEEYKMQISDLVSRLNSSHS